jgi:uncharacterized protein YaaR (DUF327 family)
MAITDQEFLAFKDLMKETINEAIEEKGLVTREDISHLPTKDQFYAETSKIYKKLNDIEEANEILTHRVYDHEDRITTVETKLNISTS